VVDTLGQASIFDAIRTPRRKQRNGSLRGVDPVDPVAGLIGELCRSCADLDPARIDDGVVSPVGEQAERGERC
jgi:acetyl-CoA C-acetyltransferase